MKKLIFDIIDAIAFIAGLSILFRSLQYFKVDFNYIYIAIGFLVVWVASKMTFRRLIGKHRKEIDKFE